MPNYYPIMLDVRGRTAIVVGGDRTAAEKAASLCASGARVILLNTEFCHEVLALCERFQVTLYYKAYERGDLAGAFVVVAATNNPELIEAIWTETQERGQLVNIVDVPARCSFIVPSIMRRDQLTIAVSTEGASPSLAKRIRQRLEGLFPPAYGKYLRLASIVRKHLRKTGLTYAQRDDFFGDYFTSDILEHLVAGDEQKAVASTTELLELYDVNVSPTTIATDLKEAV